MEERYRLNQTITDVPYLWDRQQAGGGGGTLEGLQGKAGFRGENSKTLQAQEVRSRAFREEGATEKHSWKTLGKELSHGVGCGSQAKTHSWAQKIPEVRVTEREGQEDCPICLLGWWQLPILDGTPAVSPSPLPAQITCW